MTVFTTEAQAFQVITSMGQNVSSATKQASFIVSTSGVNVNMDSGPFTVYLSAGASTRPVFGLTASGGGLFIPTITSSTSTTGNFTAYLSVTDGVGNSYYLPLRAAAF